VELGISPKKENMNGE
jgi:hypothetical protein